MRAAPRAFNSAACAGSSTARAARSPRRSRLADRARARRRPSFRATRGGVGGEHRCAAGHRLERYEPEAFGGGRDGDGARISIQRAQHAIARRDLAGTQAGTRGQRPVLRPKFADDDQRLVAAQSRGAGFDQRARVFPAFARADQQHVASRLDLRRQGRRGPASNTCPEPARSPRCARRSDAQRRALSVLRLHSESVAIRVACRAASRIGRCSRRRAMRSGCGSLKREDVVQRHQRRRGTTKPEAVPRTEPNRICTCCAGARRRAPPNESAR